MVPHVAGHELHRIVDTQSGRDRTAGRIDVDLDILVGVDRLQEQQLGLDDIGGIVVNRCSEEDNAVHHQTRKDVHGGDIQLAFLDDRRRDIGRTDRLEIMQFQRADPAMLPGIFFKFRHILRFVILSTLICGEGDLPTGSAFGRARVRRQSPNPATDRPQRFPAFPPPFTAPGKFLHTNRHSQRPALSSTRPPFTTPGPTLSALPA